MPALVALVACLSMGCEQNAVLEVALEVPQAPAEAGPTFVYVQFREADEAWPFEEAWPDGSDDWSGTRLGESPETLRYSVVADDPSLGLRMKVRFCEGTHASTAVCGRNDEKRASRAHWYEFSKPFHHGVRTEWYSGPLDIPPERPAADIDAIVVPKCEVGAPECLDAPPGGGHCREDGTHYCE